MSLTQETQGIKSTFPGSGEALAGPGQLEPGPSGPPDTGRGHCWCLRCWQLHPNLIYECPDTAHSPARGAVGQAAQEDITWLPDFMSFMFMAFFMPLPFSFLFFFFLQQHFLQMQKQQVRMRSPATTAMAMRAQGGTGGKNQAGVSPELPPSQTKPQRLFWSQCSVDGGHQEGGVSPELHPSQTKPPEVVLEPVQCWGVIRTPGKAATHRGSC